MKKKTVVIKYGGSCAPTPADLGYLFGIVNQYGPEYVIVLVVSAFKGVTNMLERLSGDTTSNKHMTHNESMELLREVKNLHKAYIPNNPAILTPLFEKLDSLYHKRNNKFNKPALYAMGEKMSARIIVARLNEMFSRQRQISYIDATQVIATIGADLFRDVPMVPLTHKKLRELNLQPGSINVIPGYYGSKLGSGMITLLSKNGSDITAALVAEALEAEELHFLKDVKGIYDDDPNVNKDANLLSKITYAQALEIAKKNNDERHKKNPVLHPSVFTYLTRRDMPIRVTHYSQAERDVGGTLIFG